MESSSGPRFGVYVDLRNPRPWRSPWADHYAETLDRICWAEELGAESVWLSEHHLFDDGYLPQPLTFAAAVAARTRRARIGTAVLLAALRHPAHIAEEAAVVDLVSGGRLELGFGAGYVTAEFDLFGVSMRGRFAHTESVVGQVRDLLTDGGVSPPPAQREIPLWLGYQSAAGARRAGEMGLRLLSVKRELVEPYREGLRAGGFDDRQARMGGLVEIIVADDPDEAVRVLRPHYAHQLNSYREAGSARGRVPYVLRPEELRIGRARSERLPGLAVLTADDTIGTVIDVLNGLPVTHAYFWLSLAGMPSQIQQRHLELLFGTVVPALHAALSALPAGETA